MFFKPLRALTLKLLNNEPSAFKVLLAVTARALREVISLILPYSFSPRANEPSSPLFISTL